MTNQFSKIKKVEQIVNRSFLIFFFSVASTKRTSFWKFIINVWNQQDISRLKVWKQ